VIIAVDGDGRREDTGIRIPVSTSPECNQERTLVKAIAKRLPAGRPVRPPGREAAGAFPFWSCATWAARPTLRRPCRRTLWPDGALAEFVHFGTSSNVRELTADEFEEWIASFPVENQ